MSIKSRLSEDQIRVEFDVESILMDPDSVRIRSLFDLDLMLFQC